MVWVDEGIPVTSENTKKCVTDPQSGRPHVEGVRVLKRPFVKVTSFKVKKNFKEYKGYKNIFKRVQRLKEYVGYGLVDYILNLVLSIDS